MAQKPSDFKVETYVQHESRPVADGLQPLFGSFGYVTARKQHAWGRHQHLNYEIIAVHRGPYRCVLNQGSLDLERGEVLVVKPGDWHQDLLKRGTGYFALGFRFQGSPEGDGVQLFNGPVRPAQQVVRVGLRVLEPAIRRIRQEAVVNDLVAAQIQDALLLEFFWRIVRVLPREQVAPSFLKRSEQAGFTLRLRRVLQRNLEGTPSVPALAEALGMSPRTLNAKCHAILNLSPARALMRYKTERAARLLRETTMPVKEIAHHLGFQNQFHFSRVFKRFQNCPPSALRQ